jgi:tetratricopeptide (TPR) repeat protein
MAADSFKDKLSNLLDGSGVGGRTHSLRQVAEGTGLSLSYLWMLKNGRRTNPTKRTLENLAGYFRVPVAYFYEDEDSLGSAASVRELLESLLREAELKHRMGEIESAQTMYRQVIAAADRAGDLPILGRAKRLLANLKFYMKETDAARRLLEESLSILGALDGVEYAAALLDMGRMHYDRADYLEAVRCVEEALRVASGAEGEVPTLVRVRSLFNLGILYRHLGRYEESLSCYERAMEQHESGGDKFHLGAIYMGMSLTLRDKGEPERALQFSQRALDIFRAMDNIKLVAEVQNNMAQAYLAIGKVDEAERCLERSAALHEVIRDDAGLAEDYLERARVYMARADWKGAQELARQAAGLYEKFGDSIRQSQAYLLCGCAGEQQGEVAEALKSYQFALGLLGDVKAPYYQAEVYYRLGELMSKQGQLEAATGHYRQAVAAYQRAGLNQAAQPRLGGRKYQGVGPYGPTLTVVDRKGPREHRNASEEGQR